MPTYMATQMAEQLATQATTQNTTRMTYTQFCTRYSTEKECAIALFKQKWPQGFRCPYCSCRSYTAIMTRRLPLYECRSCLRQTSLICGTIMEGSRTLLQKWFRAIYLITSSSGTLNAVQLAPIIQVTYKTAWLIMHKLRYAMSSCNSKQFLEGIVKIHAVQYGKPYNPTIDRHPQEHPLLAGASLNRKGAIIRLKLLQVQECFLAAKSSHVLDAGVHHFKCQHVAPDTIDVAAYIGKWPRFLFKPLIALCREASYWLNDTFHGIGSKHLQAYLEQFCFIVNHDLEQTCPFSKLEAYSASTRRITYKELTRKTSSNLIKLAA